MGGIAGEIGKLKRDFIAAGDGVPVLLISVKAGQIKGLEAVNGKPRAAGVGEGWTVFEKFEAEFAHRLEGIAELVVQLDTSLDIAGILGGRIGALDLGKGRLEIDFGDLEG